MAMLLVVALAQAATLGGVTLPDSASVNGAPVALNGIGLREKFFIDVYVGGLYLTHPTHDGATAIAADEPKRIVMQFVYSKVTRQQMIETFQEGFGSMPGIAAHQASIDQLVSWLPAELLANDQVAFDYSPGRGTTMTINDKALGTIPGPEFMTLVWTMYLGPKPPTEDLKRGLLGNLR